MAQKIKIILLLGISVIASFCSDSNEGIETGNPHTKTIVGQFDLETDSTSSQTKSLTNCEFSINKVEARATDLSEKITASLEGDYTFEMEVDPNKAYYFAVLMNSTPCGYLTFPDTVCDFEKRAIVGGGETDVNLGRIFIGGGSFYYTENNPAELSDYDEDGMKDAFDDDMNGDGTDDFDGNYDHFINVLDSTDTGTIGNCDLTNIQGEEIEAYGTLTIGNSGGDLILTGSQEFLSFDNDVLTLYNVDDEEYEDLEAVATIENNFSNQQIHVILDLETNKDFLLTIPESAFSCQDGTTLEREITYYFRTTEGAVSFACGDGE